MDAGAPFIVTQLTLSRFSEGRSVLPMTNVARSLTRLEIGARETVTDFKNEIVTVPKPLCVASEETGETIKRRVRAKKLPRPNHDEIESPRASLFWRRNIDDQSEGLAGKFRLVPERPQQQRGLGDRHRQMNGGLGLAVKFSRQLPQRSK